MCKIPERMVDWSGRVSRYYFSQRTGSDTGFYLRVYFYLLFTGDSKTMTSFLFLGDSPGSIVCRSRDLYISGLYVTLSYRPLFPCIPRPKNFNTNNDVQKKKKRSFEGSTESLELS